MYRTGGWRIVVIIGLFLLAGGISIATTGVALVVPFAFIITGLIAWDYGWRASLSWVTFCYTIIPGWLTLFGMGPFFVFSQARGLVAVIMVASALAAATLGVVMDRLRNLNEQLHRSREALAGANEDLLTALDEVKELRGFLPICACCKDIRDVFGNWEKLESYITRHSRAIFSHGLCPTCLEQQLSTIERVAR